jgi:hypothetical protein
VSGSGFSVSGVESSGCDDRLCRSSDDRHFVGAVMTDTL